MTSRRNLLRTASGVVAATVVGGALMDASPVRAQAGTDESTLSADGSSEIFVTIEGTRQKFKGESIRKGYENSIEGISFAYNVKSPRDSASGQASGKRTHHPVTFVKEWGASTPQFFQALVTNEQLSSVVIDFVRSGGDERFVYHTIKLTNAYVTELNQHKRFNSDDSRDLEAVSLVFQKIEITNDGLTASDTTSK